MTRQPSALAGFFGRREVWLPTWRGVLLLLLLGCGLAAVLVYGTFPFLAPQAPRPAGVLVVEGWVDRFVVRQAIEEFRNRRYTAVYATGQTIEEDSPYFDYGTFANYGASRLHDFGLPAAVPVPAPDSLRDRTFGSAVALRDWLRAHGGVPPDLTVITQGAHGRRTRLLFQKALGPEVRVGVISAPGRDYDFRHWWKSSIGFREVMGEAIAYVYARLLFRAGES